MRINNLIILLRHFPTQDELEDKVSSNIDTPPLLVSAVKEVDYLCEQLIAFSNRVPLKNIYCSDSSQAKQTADLIATKTGLTVIPTKLLRNIQRPLWEGLTNSEVRIRFADDFKIWCNTPGDLTFHDGENIQAVRARVKEFLNNNSDPKLVITHTTTFHSFILENFDLNNNLAWDFKPEMFCFTVLYNGTLWALNTRNLNYLTLDYK
jgi:broad specificity phosphatase PhoE